MPIFDYGRMEETFLVGRKHVEQARGVKGLLNLLQNVEDAPQPSMNITRALCCRALHGLSRDISIANTLQALEIARHLSELIRDTGHAQPFSLDHTLVDSKSENAPRGASFESGGRIPSVRGGAHRHNGGIHQHQSCDASHGFRCCRTASRKVTETLDRDGDQADVTGRGTLTTHARTPRRLGIEHHGGVFARRSGLLRTGRHDAAGGAPNEASPRLKLNFKGGAAAQQDSCVARLARS